MIIQNLTADTDVIIPNIQPDINKMSLAELIDHIELENTLYYFDRMKRKRAKQREQNRNRPTYIIKKLITTVI